MYLDNEQNILNDVCDLYIFDVLLYNGNSFNKKILRMLKDKDSIQPNFGHDETPPDFYCEKHNMMFDVLRINDCESKKGKNPIKQFEGEYLRKIKKEIPDFDEDSLEIVTKSTGTYENYKNQGCRVIEKHIREDKIEQYWEKNFPNIEHKGLLIYDETECYFEGYVTPSPYHKDKCLFIWRKDKPLTIHYPWNDKNFMEMIYKSKIDFVIWVTPNKEGGFLCQQKGIDYPTVTIIDTRYTRSKKYDEYNYDILVSM